MKNLKKLIAVVLTFTLVFSAMAVGFAGTFSDVSSSAPYASAVARLQSLGLVSGMPDGTYQPNGVVTRAQMIAFVNAAEGLQQAAQLAVGPTKFKDVPASYWASGDINIADPSGYPDGTFKPDNAVTYPEALALILRALGYTADYSWPYGVIAKATNVGITNGVTLAANATINRGQMAMLINNALDLDINKYDSNGNEVDSGTKLISKATNVTEYLVVATPDVDSSVPAGQVKVQAIAGTSSTGVISFKTPTTINAGSVDFNKYLGDLVNVYSDKAGNPVAVDVVSNDNTFTSDNANNVANVVYDQNGNVISLPSTTPVVYNGVKTTLGASGVVIYNGSNVKLVDNNNDGSYDYVVVTNAFKYGPATVSTDVKSGDSYISTSAGSWQVAGGSIKTVNVTGSVSNLADIKANDVLYYAVSADGTKVTLLDVRNSVQGTVTQVSQASDGTYTVTINGTNYTVSGNYTPNINDNGTFALDKDGKIAAFIGTSASTNYAVVLAVDSLNAVNPQIKLFTSDGSTKTYTIDTTKVSTSTDVRIGDLVSYSLDSNNNIVSLTATRIPEVASTYDTTNTKLTVNGGTYYVNPSTVVINVYNNSDNVVKPSDINVTSLNVKGYIADSYGNLSALVVDNSSLSTSSTNSTLYAIVTGVTSTTTSNGTTYTLTVLANGSQQTYTTNTSIATKPVVNDNSSNTTPYVLSLDSNNVVIGVSPFSGTPITDTITGHSSSGITTTGHGNLALSSNVTVVKYDTVNSAYQLVGLNGLSGSQNAKIYEDASGRVVLIVLQ